MTLIGCSVLAAETRVFFGTAWNSASEGIYTCLFDEDTGRWQGPVSLAAKVGEPGFVIRHPDLPVIYASASEPGNGVAEVAAFQLNEAGELSLKNRLPTHCGRVTHLAIDATRRWLVTAHYPTGSIAVFSLEQDGSIRERVLVIKLEGGSGVHPRQQQAHPHYVAISPDNAFVLIPDLGADAIFVYALDPDSGQLRLHEKVATAPGAGPRHMKFSPDGKWAWVLNELNLTVATYAWNEEQGKLVARSSVPVLPEALIAGETENTASEVQVHPSGRFLYTGNRGNDSISVFAVDPSSGALARVEIEPVRAAWPRHFAIDPSGKWIVCAGQESSNAGIFAIDEETGGLTYQRQSSIPVPGPTCVLFVP